MEFLFVIGFLGFICLILSPVAFFMALSAQQKLSETDQRLRVTRNQLEAAERRLQALEAASPSASPAPPAEMPQTSPIAPAAPPPMPVTAQMPEVPAATSPPPPPPFAPPVVPSVPPPGPTQPRTRSFEELLGTRWAVAVGGIALALGALLLVRFSIEQGWFGPAARIILGLVLAVALVAAGETLRRRAKTSANAYEAGPLSIPAVLTAAGTVAAFGSVYAAHALYGFIGPSAAFLALGLIGLAAILAAALHGPALGAVGLIAALTAPLLVSSNEPNPWPVVIYVGVITACTYGLARLRYWLWLAFAAAAGAFIWGVLLLQSHASGDAAIAHAVLQTCLATLLFVAARRSALPDAEKTQDPISMGAPSAFALLTLLAIGSSVAVVSSTTHFGTGALTATVLTIAVLLTAGLRAYEAAGLSLTAGIFFAAIFVVWPDAPAPHHAATYMRWPEPNDANLFVICMSLGSAALAFFPTRRLWAAPRCPQTVAAIFTATACLVPLCALIVAYLRLHVSVGDSLLAASAGGVSFIALFAATLFRNRLVAERSAALRLGLGGFAATALAALALGLVFEFERGTLTIALALSALGAAFVDRRLDIPSLRWCVLGLGLVVAARLALDPQIVGANLGKTPIFNWLLAGYGIPAAAFALSARLIRTRREDMPVHVAQGLAILLAIFLVFFETRHALNGGDPFAPTFSFLEQGLLATESFAFAIILTRLDATRSNIVLRSASLGLGLISFALSLFGLLIVENPIMSSISIEGGFINTLWLAYLLPAILAYALNRVARGVRPDWYRLCARITAYALFFAFLNLQVRHIFHGEMLNILSWSSPTEVYSYSALWLALGILCLGLGIWRRSNEARIVSIILVALAVGKVFVLDLTGLTGILRALSFIGLGFALIGIGFVYQKFVFARPSDAA